ncbi:dicarboxylate transporter/tellurite-resistance protein TehA [Mesorhizobium sp. B283B1A]|uniref:SLAC1 family transporter n=1 Tax=Mesorhizobium TaxID=68287 RepID=UPI001CD047A0|nr:MULTISPECIES: dicarboxylate transporter/tellurite-resistance protein TehA [Mesorhizobium]MCA0046311.1 dicarboxylate transporter/tellurite-resistance protein TehA [Mesorhizobium sp. B283B1A]UQS62773.1 dicarboxylate transporter/tellurite-resistance protein TehA [Mesorhizobium opportunistum]
MKELLESDGVVQVSGLPAGAMAALERQPVLHLPTERSLIARFPASFFAIGLGTSSFAVMWQVACQLWAAPKGIAVAAVILAMCVWAALLFLYALKLWLAPLAVRAELADPVQNCFPGLAGVGIMLTAVSVLPFSATAATILLGIGGLFAVGFGFWHSQMIWKAAIALSDATPALYLPVAAASFVLSIGLSAFGRSEWAQLALGAGLFSWLTIDSVLFYRLYFGEPLRDQIRPTLGVQLAPPAVCSLAYVNASGTSGDVFVHCLIGYAILQAVVLGGVLPRIVGRFSAGLWSVSFGATALATTVEKLAISGDAGLAGVLALPIFAAANLLIMWLAARTIILAVTGSLLPAPPEGKEGK